MKQLLTASFIFIFSQISFCQFTAEESKIIEKGFPVVDTLIAKGMNREAIAIIDSLLLRGNDELSRVLLHQLRASSYLGLSDQSVGLESSIYCRDYWIERGGDTTQIKYAEMLATTAYYETYQGNYPSAENYFLRALDMYEKLDGKKNMYYPDCLASLADVYRDWGKYEKSQAAYDEALPMVVEQFGKESKSYMTHAINYAALCSDMGMYDKSINALDELLPVVEKIMTKKDKIYHLVLNDLALGYNYTGEYDRAIPLLQEALELTEKYIGKDDQNYASMLNNLAQSYNYKNEFDKAEPLYEAALKITTSIFGRDHPSSGPSFNNLAYVQTQIGKYKESEKNFLQVLSILETHLGKNHFYYRVTLKNMANLFIKMEDFDKAESYLIDYLGITRENIERAFSYLSENEKTYYIRNVVGYNEVLKSISLMRPNPSFHMIQYDLALFEKGLLLNNSIATRKYLELNASPEVKALQNALISTKEALYEEYAKPPSSRLHIDSLQLALEKFEKSLARQSVLYRKELAQNELSSQDLMAQLNPDELAIEFRRFNYYDPYATDSIIYTAVLLDPALGIAHYTYLCDEKSMSLFSKTKSRRSDYVETLYTNAETMKLRGNEQKSLYELIWEPLEEFTDGKKKIYYSSSGLLNRINLGAIIDEDGKIMSEKFELANYSSTRSIVEDAIEYSNNTAYLIGGVNYKYEDEVKDAEAIVGEEISEGDFIIDEKLRGDEWNFLPGTLWECKSISETMIGNDFTIDYKSGDMATEESFKALGTKEDAPRVIHLATHGFFFPDPGSTQSNDSSIVYKVSENAMLRSGILFAGANETWGSEAKGGDDGILTAFEIANLNLSQTELVVLSACETGLGDINGTEGVYGLQRAFKKAGVQNLIMSLWKVPDTQTSDFMSQFYKNWLDKKMTIRKAFDTTQKEMKAKYTNPYAWAGFVLIE